jgi:hypothetical protein
MRQLRGITQVNALRNAIEHLGCFEQTLFLYEEFGTANAGAQSSKPLLHD